MMTVEEALLVVDDADAPEGGLGLLNAAEVLAAEVRRLNASLQQMTDDRDSWERQASDRTDDAVRLSAHAEMLAADVHRLNTAAAEDQDRIRKLFEIVRRG